MKNLDEVREFWVFRDGMSGKVIGAENSDYKPSGISGGGSTQAIKVVEKKSYSKLKDEEWRKVVEPLLEALKFYSTNYGENEQLDCDEEFYDSDDYNGRYLTNGKRARKALEVYHKLVKNE